MVIGWMDSWATKSWPTKAWGWAGAMTVPRRLRLSPDGTPLWAPVPEIETLRSDPASVPPGEFGPGRLALDAVRGDSLDLEVEIDPGRASEVALLLRRSADGRQETRLAYDRARATLAIDRERAGRGMRRARSAPGPRRRRDAATPRPPRPLVRRGVRAGRRVVLTDRVYPDAASVGVALEARGDRARLVVLRSWRLAR